MKYLHDIATIAISSEVCIGCGKCIDVCPAAVLEINEKKAVVVNRDNCIECGACAKNCIVSAVNVDSGVGCAAAMINGLIKYGDIDKGTCDCSSTSQGTSGCC